MTLPKKYEPDRAPQAILELVKHLVPRLVEGDHPALIALQRQWQVAQIGTVEIDDSGFFADLVVPADTPLAEPPNFAGGCANITASGVQHGADCVLFVRNGRLSLLDVYTLAHETWPDDAVVLSISIVAAIYPGMPPFLLPQPPPSA
jgi:hypothetical protein